MEKIKITFIDTESHGYYKISKKIFKQLNLDINLFSNYSFVSCDDYFFEEDCDYPTFLNNTDLEIELKRKEMSYEKWNMFSLKNLERIHK
jgi:hypothetical protein